MAKRTRPKSRPEVTDTGAIIYTQPVASSGAASFSATWTVDSTGWITMGLVAPQGELPSGYGVQVGSFTTQTDVRNTWSDGSCRFALVSFNATSTGSKSVVPITNPGGSLTPTWPSASVALAVSSGPGAGGTFTATLPSFTGTQTTCNGALCRRAWTVVTPLNGGTPHDNLQVIFEVTSYIGGVHEVDCIVQNTKNVSTMDECTYDATVTINGSAVFSPGLNPDEADDFRHFTGQWWHKSGWVGGSEAVVRHDFTPWERAKAIPHIVAASTRTYDFTGDNYKIGANGGSYFGEMTRDSATNGSFTRPELQFVNEWDARLFANNTDNNRLASLKNGDASGEWTFAINETDGYSTLKVTEAPYTSDTTDYQGNTGTGGAQSNLGNWKFHADGSYWAGGRIGGHADVNPTNVNNEHMAEPCMVPYLLTGHVRYYKSLRDHGTWAILMAAVGSWSEGDARFFPGLMQGRNGTQGLVSNTGVTREFATPLKNLLHAAWCIADDDADQSYYRTIAQNNLDYLGTYVAYWRDNNLGGSLEAFGGAGGGANWQYARSNSISATTNNGNGTTTLTVIGDNSGVGTGTNDHGAQTGDYVAISGVTTSGATALNGTHVGPITRLSATQFRVGVTTSANTTSEGTYSFVTGFKSPPWRLWFTAYEVDWATRVGLWTISADITEFVARACRWAINMNAGMNDTEFITNGHSAYAHAYYPSFGYVTGDTISWYSTMTDLITDNGGTSSGRLFDSQALYTAVSSSSHRGNPQGWNDSEAAVNYVQHALTMLAIAKRRGLSGATTAYNRQIGLSGITTELETYPGGYIDFVY